jgi:V/A-type H+-transporting ATPase subunit C
MPSSGVLGYAGIQARVRAMYSTMLTPVELSEILRTTNFNSLITMLRRSVYGPFLARVDDNELTPRRAVYQIKSQIADAYNTVIRVTPAPTRPLITQLYRGFEVDNLKAILRGILSGASWDRIRHVLFPLGKLAILPAQAMVDAGSINAAVEQLRGTPYYETLSHAMERYLAEQSLFPLEVALDLTYWRGIWQGINRLSKSDRQHALRIVGSLIDINNLMWVIRYRVYHHLSEEELINYTLPFGYRVRDEDIRAIAAGADIPQVVEHVYPNLSNVGALLLEPRDGLPELEAQLQRNVVQQCRKTFIGSPFHIGIPLAYLVLKRMEIQDLTVLVEAKSSQVSTESFRPYLVMDYAGR